MALFGKKKDEVETKVEVTSAASTKKVATKTALATDYNLNAVIVAPRVTEKAIGQKRDRLQSLLIQNIPGLVVNGNQSSRLAGNLHISVLDIPNSAVIARVRHKLAISTGSACSSGVETPSHVLRAMNLGDDLIEGSLRIGLGKFTTDEEINQCAAILIDAIAKIRELM